MIAYATDGRNENQPKEYQELYIDLDLLIEEAGYNNPNPYKTIELFWKDRGSSWAQRRELVGKIIHDKFSAVHLSYFNRGVSLFNHRGVSLFNLKCVGFKTHIYNSLR